MSHSHIPPPNVVQNYECKYDDVFLYISLVTVDRISMRITIYHWKESMSFYNRGHCRRENIGALCWKK